MAFIIDDLDREIIAWTALSGAGDQRLGRARHNARSRRERCGYLRALHPVEHLSDNGSRYTAKEARDFATSLNLVPSFTPVKSPESNGMSKAFVK